MKREKTSAFLMNVMVVWEWQAPLEISDGTIVLMGKRLLDIKTVCDLSLC